VCVLTLVLLDRCPVHLPCLSVVLVYCGQTVGWIRMPLGTDVGLSDNVLDGDRAPSMETGTAAPPPLFGPCLLWPNSYPSQLLLNSLGNLHTTQVV